jgi:hypothetical protein
MTALDDGIRAAAADAVAVARAGAPILYVISLTAVLDDGPEADGGIRWFDTVCDQRDQHQAMQMVPDSDSDAGKLALQWACAWSNLQRTNALDMGWEMFKKHVIQVMPTEGIPIAVPVDPTRPAPVG